jgi:hypothetical protein
MCHTCSIFHKREIHQHGMQDCTGWEGAGGGGGTCHICGIHKRGDVRDCTGWEGVGGGGGTCHTCSIFPQERENSTMREYTGWEGAGGTCHTCSIFQKRGRRNSAMRDYTGGEGAGGRGGSLLHHCRNNDSVRTEYFKDCEPFSR